MEKRIHNFNAGPAVLPEEVLREAQADLFSYKGKGLSVMEMSHRSKDFQEIIDNAMATIKRLYELGDDYDVLFLQGGASTQFLMVPMNYAKDGMEANYINTGVWSTKAIKEAKKIGKTVHVAASSEDRKFAYIPKSFELSANPSYLHITTNNTIYGTEWKTDPVVPTNVPLIADMSSNFMSKPVDMKRYSLVYAGAQKNVGPAGCTIVIARKSYLEQVNPNIPTMLDYKTHAGQGSLYNTPPCFAIYMIGLVVKWMEEYGGLSVIEQNNIVKANYIYNMIDASEGFYRGTVDKDSRSLMNVTFRMASDELENMFIDEAKKQDMIGLKGHRDVGGCRASIYNSLPLESAHALAEFMKEFMRKHG